MAGIDPKRSLMNLRLTCVQKPQKLRTEAMVLASVALALTSLLSGCASNEGTQPLQKHVFSDDDLYDGVRFYVGPWYAPGRSYAYQYQDGVMVLSDSFEAGYDVQSFNVNYCDGLSDAYDELIESVVETIDYATGGSPEWTKDIWVLDGPSYLLQYSGELALTTTEITLEGSINTGLLVPWVDSALHLREIALDCTDSSGSRN